MFPPVCTKIPVGAWSTRDLNAESSRIVDWTIRSRAPRSEGCSSRTTGGLAEGWTLSNRNRPAEATTPATKSSQEDTP